MAKHKLQRFAENETFTNLFQHQNYDVRNDAFPMKGHWHNDYFHNENPIVVEVGCGRGEYTVAMARQFPDKNFVGMDRKGARIWRGCKDATIENITNAAFIRGQIDDIERYFGPGEVAEIWVTFPDPQPKKARRRLVSPNFVERYCKVWGPKGILHLKTDSRLLYEYILETAGEENWKVLQNIEHVYAEPKLPFLTEIQTFYEKKWLEQDSLISYVKVEVDNSAE
ncbi:MAG: tRNA (guanosine(46)-N7)-methyltransferase TrmB [Bacteroidales bacterium]|nr:tRNA (guanosine(46)-N7)-methyltransferase TrmB [Bacteroidales bacterium]